MAKGTNTASVITSCMIFSCASDSSVKPMRLAGTCSRYSKSAMPQLTSAAIHHGFAESSRRCAYQAKVMKMLEATSSDADTTTVCSCISGDPFHSLVRGVRQARGRGTHARDGDPRRDLEQRLQHERALVHAGMRQ